MVRLLVVFLVLACPGVWAATPTTVDRRVELEKQDKLEPTEVKNTLPAVPTVQPKKLSGFQLAFLRTLTPRKVVLRHDLCQVIGLLTGNTDQPLPIDEQIKRMNELGLIPPELQNNFNPMQPLTKGLAAYTFCRLLKIKGGLMIRAFGLSQRYAVRELADMRMIRGAPGETMSGEELMILVMKSLDYMEAEADR